MSYMFKMVTPPTEQQILAMMNMQDELNQRINKDWINQRWDFGVAVADECMEALGHIGWKWWKDAASYKAGITQHNLRQFQLELIDMWHFALSMGLEESHFDKKDRWVIATEAAEYLTGCYEDMEQTILSGTELEKDPQVWLKNIMSTATSSDVEFAGSFDMASFYMLMCLANLDGDELYNIYTGKFALNKFRYANGYAEGIYLKNWLLPTVSSMYQEDNWYLEKILGDLTLKGEAITAEKVYGSLLYYYKQVANGGK